MKSSDMNPFVRVGNRWYLPGTDITLPVVSGAEDDPPKDPPDPKEGEGGGENKDKKVDLTQADLTRITTREKKEGKVAGRAELMKELGVETEAQLKEVLDAHRTAVEKDKSEAQKEKEAATKEKSEAEAEKAAAKQERFEVRCERALLKADCPAETVEKVQRLLDIKAADDLSQDDIAEAVEALKKEMPQLFAVKKGGNQQGDPGKGSSTGGGTKSNTEQARDMLAQRHPELANKT